MTADRIATLCDTLEDLIERHAAMSADDPEYLAVVIDPARDVLQRARTSNSGVPLTRRAT